MFGVKKNAKKEFERIKESDYSEEAAKELLKNEKKLNKIALGPSMKKYADDLKLFFRMLKDFISRKYPYLPVRVCAVIVGTFVYLFAPLDFLPDFLPAMGFLDDAALVALCVKFAAQDIDDYKTWLSSKGCNEEESDSEKEKANEFQQAKKPRRFFGVKK